MIRLDVKVNSKATAEYLKGQLADICRREIDYLIARDLDAAVSARVAKLVREAIKSKEVQMEIEHVSGTLAQEKIKALALAAAQKLNAPIGEAL